MRLADHGQKPLLKGQELCSTTNSLCLLILG